MYRRNHSTPDVPSKQITVAKCYYCGTSRFSTMYRILGDKTNPLGSDLVSCDVCELAFVSPRCTEEYLKESYSEDYFTSVIRDVSGVDRCFIWEREAKVRDHRLENGYVSGLLKGGRVLDFGSGPGFFFDALDGYWEKYAIDLSSYALDQITDPHIEKYCGELMNAGYPSEFFDFIHCRHVLDRMENPAGILKECERIMKRHGVLVVTVPNISSICAKIFKSRFRLLYTNHLIYFSPTTLGRFLEDAGFDVREVRYPFWGSSFFDGRALIGSIGKIIFQAFALKLGVKKVFWPSPPFFGSVMTVVATKRG